ncbi:MAG: sulfotransferase domain-containing protein [Actinomycetota bacterium]
MIKDPHGCAGAELMSQALPLSRFILMVRDPRDVLASVLDANQPGSWMHRERKERAYRRLDPPPVSPDPAGLLGAKTDQYVRDMEQGIAGFRAHNGPKTVVRYEDLRTETMSLLRRVREELDLPLDEANLRRVVRDYSWENVPVEKKGSGSFYRKAKVGSWRVDLTPEQARLIEARTGSILREFYGVR